MDDEKPSSWGALIPEFYFDLIARSGSPVLLSYCVYAWMGEGGLAAIARLAADGKLEGIPFAALFALLMFGGFAVGIILSPLGAWVGRSYGQSVWSQAEKDFPELKRAAHARYLEPGKPVKSWHNLHRLMHDDLKASHPHARVLLPKMAAEEALCTNLAVSIVIISLIMVARSPSSVHWGLVATLLAVAVLMGVAARSRHMAFIRRQFSFLRLVTQTASAAV